MTFSEFAKMLYPYLGEDKRPYEFIIFLTTQIMDKDFTDANFENHPLENKKPDTLARIYNGTRPLGKTDARVIINHLDKERFGGYLSERPADTLDLICKAMVENRVPIVDDDLIDTCTDLFVSILNDCVVGDVKSNSHDKFDATPRSENISQNEDTGAQLSIPKQYKICMFCAKWDGNANHAYKVKTGVYGTCMMYNRNQLSTGGIDCNDYVPNYSKITTHKLSQRPF